MPKVTKFNKDSLREEEKSIQEVARHLAKNRKKLPSSVIVSRSKDLSKREKELQRRKRVLERMNRR